MGINSKSLKYFSKEGRYSMVLDWLPFIILFLSYQALRIVVPLIISRVHIFPMIRIDQDFFGFIPTVYLQNIFFNPKNIHWYDYLTVFIYIIHDVTPLIIGYIFWRQDRVFFKRYSFALILLSYLTFFTYILFPAMPPWMASHYGYIPPIKDITSIVMSQTNFTRINFPSASLFFAADPIAAMPSLHVAFPLLILFYLSERFGKTGLLFLPYFLAVCFAVIYLGQHYFIDIVVGMIYALTVYTILKKREHLLGLLIPAYRVFPDKQPDTQNQKQ